MAASISSVTTRGFGNGTFVGDINLVVTLGYGIGSGVATITAITTGWTAPRSLLDFDAYPMLLHYTAPKSRTEGEANEP